MPNIYVGEVGVKIIVNTTIDLSTASSVSLEVKKPDGTEVSWTAMVDGKNIVYITQAGDLDQSGFYKVQAKVEYSDGSVYLGDTTGFHVYDRFE